MMELITTTTAAVTMDTLRSFTLGEIVYLETEHGCTLLFEGTIPYQKSSKRQKIQNIALPDMWLGVPCSTSECEADRARWRSVEHMQGV